MGNEFLINLHQIQSQIFTNVRDFLSISFGSALKLKAIANRVIALPVILYKPLVMMLSKSGWNAMLL